jgi:hypothetical protein
MELARGMLRHGYYPLSALKNVIQDQQGWRSGQPPAGNQKYKQLRSLSQSLIAYSIIKVRLARMDRTWEAAHEPGASQCPCCSVTCEAVCADACLGMRRFAKVALQQRDLQPLITSSRFVPEACMAAAQQAARGRVQWEDATPACSNFKAATLTAAEAPKYDRTGMGAFLCRHGFVLLACILTGRRLWCTCRRRHTACVHFYVARTVCCSIT